MATDAPRFRIDDAVCFLPQKHSRLREVPSERFVVVAVMPCDRAGIHQYRIRPVGPGPLRMATEQELKR